MLSIKDLPSWLQKNHSEKYMFGLGFIQVKVDETTRYHFYHPELEALIQEEEAHDHRYDFKSEVLKGCLRQEIYDVRLLPGASTDKCIWSVKEVSCDPLNPANEESVACKMNTSMVIACSADSDYKINRNTFHRVLPTREPTVTKLTRGAVVKDFARVLRKTRTEEVCPFSPNMTDEELWGWVRRIVEE